MIKSRDRNKEITKFIANNKIVTDEFISANVFVYLQEHIENLLKSFRTAVTNEQVRDTIKKMTIKTIKQEEKYLKYLKLKGWIEVAPLNRPLLTS
ncbi:hypothetical protein MFMK1_000374 [Metallumcola ferriviriculae]|uniref:Uncharacterized protein n=1 Tax=Metallumcola ferriviriculae TaxID=3039180 RepID=A0AAU0UHU4_9FIRM|nr:hypothetical protein MFMK1_000374 [Desulfitibacteraceae bacterium MK1]